MKKQLLAGALAASTLAAGTFSAMPADALTLSGSSGTRSASVTLSTSNNNLLVQLTNTGGAAGVPTDVLTGIFFDIAAPVPQLSLTAASIAPGSSVVQFDNTAAGAVQATQPTSILAPPTGNFVGGWQYQSGNAVSGKITDFDAGSGTSGFGIFNGNQVNNGGQGGNFNYGLINGYNFPATKGSPNNAVRNALLVNNSVLLTLAGLQPGFSLNQIQAVRFQYGTDLSEPSLVVNNNPQPIPTPALLPAALGTGLAILRKKKQEEKAAQNA
jgi:hypothetical protein